jgi:hypothetical protein
VLASWIHPRLWEVFTFVGPGDKHPGSGQTIVRLSYFSRRI